MAIISVGKVKIHGHRVRDDLPMYIQNDFIRRLYRGGYDPFIIFVFMEATTTTVESSMPHTTDTEVFPANSKLGLGGGTAVNVIVVSDQLLDDADNVAGNAHTIRLTGWGVDAKGTNRILTENITMNGITNVTSTYKYYEVFHATVIDWGSSNDKHAEGNITIEYPENTTLLTISAGKNTSNGSGFTVPLGWYCKPLCSKLITYNVTLANGIIGEIRGINEHSDGDKINLDNNYIRMKAVAYHSDNQIPDEILHRNGATNELRIEHHMGHIGSTNKGYWFVCYVLWKQTITKTLDGVN